MLIGVITATPESPIGPILLVADGDRLVGLYTQADERRAKFLHLPKNHDHPILQEAAFQLAQFFASERKVFDLPLGWHGTPFQESVWRIVADIPHGTTRTYGEIAHQLGNPGSSRAVGAANGQNPLSIVVPCHRVVGSSGLTGYAGGLEAKKWLLEFESAQARLAL